MSSISGFDQFGVALECHVGVTRTRSISVQSSGKHLGLTKRIVRRAILSRKGLDKQCPGMFVEPRHEMAGIKVLKTATKHKQALIVLPVGENQLGTAIHSADASIKQRLVVCLHQPPSYLSLHWRDFSALNGLRAVVCLSCEQKRFIESKCDSPVLLIKHGVRHDFFTPHRQERSKEKKVLFVGQWLRDYDLLYEVMTRVWSAIPDVELDCVIPRNAREQTSLLRLARDERTRWHSNISPESLLNLYRNSTLLLQTLIDAAANNAVVEAIACGVPVVATNVGGIPEYVQQECGIVCRAEDAAAHADAVIELCNQQHDPSAEARRRWAERHLDWNSIAAQFLQLVGAARAS